MECPLFYTTALINDYIQVKTLINNRSIGYAIINEKLAQRLVLPMVDIVLR